MKKQLTALTIAIGALAFASAAAQAQEKVKIGFVTDMSSLYADFEGKNGAVAIQMAIDDFGGKALGQPIELLTADHQNKADTASSKAREWIDTKDLTMLFGGSNSGAALATAQIANEKKRVYFNNAAGTSLLTNEQCGSYTVHYAFDTVALAKGTASAVVDRGGDSWYFLTVDYAFGQAMESDATAAIKAKKGTVIGSVRHPINAADFSAFLLQAQASKAKILGIANAGGDLANSIKAAREFGVSKNMKTAAFVIFLSDIHSLGLKNTEGLLHTTSWYWDQSNASREWAARFFEKTKRMPTDIQAADYSATMTYLNAVKAVNTTDSDKVMAQLKKTPIDDFYAKGFIRQDGRFVHDMYLAEVKSPAESKKPWDYLKIVAKLPGEQVFTSRAESRCLLWK